MCTAMFKPTKIAPPPVPDLPEAEDGRTQGQGSGPGSAAAMEARRRARRSAAANGRRNTLLTSGLGLAGSGNVGKKTLLGT
jgi:hypothetical protein|tara:strand:- start:3698 stop:3940 length:243 start_codon:yes stop_codon:yes gene_type:complete